MVVVAVAVVVVAVVVVVCVCVWCVGICRNPGIICPNWRWLYRSQGKYGTVIL